MAIDESEEEMKSDALKIWEMMNHRYEEMWNKIALDDCNNATPLAYKLGFIADIQMALNNIERQRKRRVKKR